MGSLIDKGKVADKISDLFLDKYETKANSDLTEFYKEVLKILINEKSQSGWISVKDRLPTSGDPVMVTTGNWGDKPDVCTAQLWTNKDGSNPEWRDYYGDDVERMMGASVTHWTYLPTPPEKENNDE